MCFKVLAKTTLSKVSLKEGYSSERIKLITFPRYLIFTPCEWKISEILRSECLVVSGYANSYINWGIA